MNLTTTAKLKAHLGIPSADTSKDSKLATLIAGASRYLEGQTKRSLGFETHTLKLDGSGTDELMLPQYPVHAIVDVSVDDVAMSDEEIAALDIDTKTGIVYRPNGERWTFGRRNIEIVFQAGYLEPDESESGSIAPVPEDLELAAIRLAARVYERSTAEGVSSVSPAGSSVQYKDAVDDEIKEIIGRYERFR